MSVKVPMPDYKTNDPKGWCGDPQRGAALGRATIHEAPEDWAGALTLREIHIDQQGYDDNGTYWGFTEGEHLFWYANEEDTIDACVRAKDMEEAKRIILETYPRVTFAAPAPVDPAFVSAYIEAALWSSVDEDDTPLDSEHCESDLADDTRAKMVEDCEAFQRTYSKVLHHAYETMNYSPSHAGHDFWLTRNGHGAGFWDRGLGDTGKQLTDAAEAYGDCHLYVADDGKIETD